MKTGDIVRPKRNSGFVLHSGCSWYEEAVVISTSPLILLSLEGDMRWEATVKPEYFEVVRDADRKVMINAIERLLRESK